MNLAHLRPPPEARSCRRSPRPPCSTWGRWRDSPTAPNRDVATHASL